MMVLRAEHTQTTPMSVDDAHVAQSVEHFLGKEEVTGSNPVVGFQRQGFGATVGEFRGGRKRIG